MATSYERAPAGRPQSSRGAVQKMGGASGLADVLVVILDKGLVVDAWVRLSIIGIEILTLEIRAVVASVDTYLRYAEAIGLTALAAGPRAAEPIAIPDGLFQNGVNGNGRQPMMAPAGGPADDEVLAYLDAHPDGVRMVELQAYFGLDRARLESILGRLVQGTQAILDPVLGVYRAAHALAPAIP